MWILFSVTKNDGVAGFAEMTLINMDQYSRVTEFVMGNIRRCKLWHRDAVDEYDRRNVVVTDNIAELHKRLIKERDAR